MKLCHNTYDPETYINYNIWGQSKLTSGDENNACQEFVNIETRIRIKKSS